MLVLTRRIGESIVINGNISLKIIGHKGGGVRVGIEAPESVRVDRSEVHDLRERWQIPSEQNGSRTNTMKRTHSLMARTA